MGHYRQAIPVDRAVLDLCDSAPRAFALRYRFVKDPLRKAYCAWEHKKTRSEMEKSARYFDEWLVISELEADSLRVYFPGVPTSVVGNSLPQWQKCEVMQPRENLIVLTGNFDYFPNVDAAVYFANEVMPLLRHTQEGCKLRIIGGNPPPAVRRLVAPDIEVTGYVEDFPAAVSEGAVFVCPLRLGTGIKNKVLEAMDFGVPVVSTSVGVEGTTALPGIHYLQAENAGNFVDCVSRLLRHPSLRGELVRNARQLIRACFSNDIVREQLRGVFARVGLVGN
jgi:glycosyltransferase involved in cell wall biosynthesis